MEQKPVAAASVCDSIMLPRGTELATRCMQHAAFSPPPSRPHLLGTVQKLTDAVMRVRASMTWCLAKAIKHGSCVPERTPWPKRAVLSCRLPLSCPPASMLTPQRSTVLAHMPLHMK